MVAPIEQIEPHIRRLWKARRTDPQILQEVLKHIDTDQYGIGYVFMAAFHRTAINTILSIRLTRLREIRRGLGLLGSRQQGHTPETIHDAMVELRQIYPNAGAREMISLLFHERGMAVPR